MLELVGEALSWYQESIAAFWTAMARGGMFRLLLVGLVLWWIFGRKGRCCGACPRCGCWCGHCRCREVDGTARTAETDAEADDDA